MGGRWEELCRSWPVDAVTGKQVGRHASLAKVALGVEHPSKRMLFSLGRISQVRDAQVPVRTLQPTQVQADPNAISIFMERLPGS
mmetsp:Transcript_70276/g.177079  ORF Transcript_70276/g.177079 Transcript_70276/m.177079 type:complete len:85 (+) Transcript_70276:91-345(+)